jgi:hypothetical protein
MMNLKIKIFRRKLPKSPLKISSRFSIQKSLNFYQGKNHSRICEIPFKEILKKRIFFSSRLTSNKILKSFMKSH